MTFDELYEAHFQPVYRYILYMVANESIAEDLTQDVFVRLYRKKTSANATYIRQTARHIVIDYYRKRALIQWLPFTREHERTSTTHIPHDWLAANEQRAILFQALQKLKPIQREIIIYRKIEELSLEETAHITGYSITKIANTQRSAMKKLQQLLGGEEDA